MTPETIKRFFGLAGAPFDGILVGFGMTLLGVLPASVSTLTLGSGWYGLALSALLFAVLGFRSHARRVAREEVERRLVAAEALAAGLQGVVDSLLDGALPVPDDEPFDADGDLPFGLPLELRAGDPAPVRVAVDVPLEHVDHHHPWDAR